MKIRVKTILMFLLSMCGFFSIASCGDRSNVLHTEFIQFGNKGMNPYEDYVFETGLDSTLTNFPVDAWLMLRYSDQCHINELSLKIESSCENSDSIIKTKINIPLFDKAGFNKKRDGYGIYETEIPLLNNIDVSDGSFLSLQTQNADTHGIMAIGIILKKN